MADGVSASAPMRRKSTLTRLRQARRFNRNNDLAIEHATATAQDRRKLADDTNTNMKKAGLFSPSTWKFSVRKREKPAKATDLAVAYEQNEPENEDGLLVLQVEPFIADAPSVADHQQSESPKVGQRRNSKVLELSLTALEWLKKAAATDDSQPGGPLSPSSSIAPSPTITHTTSELERDKSSNMAEKSDKARKLSLKMPILPRMMSAKTEKNHVLGDADMKDQANVVIEPLPSSPSKFLPEGRSKKGERKSMISLRSLSSGLGDKRDGDNKSLVDVLDGSHSLVSKESRGTLKKLRDAIAWSSQHQPVVDVVNDGGDMENEKVPRVEKQKSNASNKKRRPLLWQKNNISVETLQSEPLASSDVSCNSASPLVNSAVDKQHHKKKERINLFRSMSVDVSLKKDTQSVPDLSPLSNVIIPQADRFECVVAPTGKSPASPLIPERKPDDNFCNRPRRSYDSSIHVRQSYDSAPINLRPISKNKNYMDVENELAIRGPDIVDLISEQNGRTSGDELMPISSSSTLVQDEATVLVVSSNTVEQTVVESLLQEEPPDTEEELNVDPTWQKPSHTARAQTLIEPSSPRTSLPSSIMPLRVLTTTTTTTLTAASSSFRSDAPKPLERDIAESRDILDLPSPAPVELPSQLVEQREVGLNKSFPATTHPSDASDISSVTSPNRDGHFINIAGPHVSNISSKREKSSSHDSKSPSPVEQMTEAHVPIALSSAQAKSNESASLITLLNAPAPAEVAHVEPVPLISPAFADLMGLMDTSDAHVIANNSVSIDAASALTISEPAVKSVVSSLIIDLFDPIRQLPTCVAENADLARTASRKSMVSVMTPSISLSLPRSIKSEGYPTSLASTPTTSASPSTPFPNTPSESKSPELPPSVDASLLVNKRPTKTPLIRTALSEYAPTRTDEMMVSVGDSISVSAQYSDGWALGRNETTGEHGVFPLAVFDDVSSSDELEEQDDDDGDEVSSAEQAHSSELEGDLTQAEEFTSVRLNEVDSNSSEEELQFVVPGNAGKPPIFGVIDHQARPTSIDSHTKAGRRPSTFEYLWSSIIARASAAPLQVVSARITTPSPSLSEEPQIRYLKKDPPIPPPRSRNAASVPALLSAPPVLYVHYDLVPTRPDELALRVGDVVIIEAAYADGWGFGNVIQFDSDRIRRRNCLLPNEQGWVPICYLREEEPELLDSSADGSEGEKGDEGSDEEGTVRRAGSY
ncbi:hypothetical protein SeMB42_g03947 [Synchytrium endobioticum]|uniref:SH3 domain-containing protein n=1 Tax=Synchytrium endobioticum TaxID=286115 RepID=A0A507D2D9_9FUNG|nr:hypothetical protein SeMB42_g03947 [Synchytrium endobioticum]